MESASSQTSPTRRRSNWIESPTASMAEGPYNAGSGPITRPCAPRQGPPVLRRIADPRLPWSLYLAGIVVGLIAAGGLLALLMTP